MVGRDLRGEGVAEPLFGPMLKVTTLSVLISRLRLYLSSFSLMAFGVGLSSPADGFGVKRVPRVERGVGRLTPGFRDLVQLEVKVLGLEDGTPELGLKGSLSVKEEVQCW